MVGNQLEQEIIRLYNQDITSLYSINQIAHILDKAYPYINKKVNNLIKNKILKKTVRGKSYLCSINLESDKATWLLILNDIQRHEKAKTQVNGLDEWITELKKAITIHLSLVSKNRTIFVVENPECKDILLNSAKLKSKKVEAYTKREFINLILDDKTLLEEHIILHGYEKYYHYLREVEPQLRIKYSSIK